MNNSLKWAGLALALVVLVGIGWWAFGRDVTQPALEDPIAEIEGWKEFRNDELGLAFRYPSDYFLEEKDLGSGERMRRQLILTEDTEENRKVREGEAPGREGPVAITVEVTQNDLDRLSALQWAQNSSASNFKLSGGEYATTTLYGHETVAYAWDGLYQGDTIVISTDKRIYAFTTTYIGPEDRIRQDFVKVLATTEID